MPPQVGVSSPQTPGQSGAVMVNPDGTKISGNERIFRDITFDSGVKSGSLSAKATGSTVLTGTNNDLDFAADTAGLAGNDIIIEYINPGAVSQALAVSVSGTRITVSLATNSSGVITSTAALITTAIGANVDAAALIDVTNHSGNDGTGVVTAMAPLQFSGGSDGTVPLFTVKGACLVSLRAYCETTLAGASGTLVHGKTGTTNDLIPSFVGTTATAGDGIDSTGRVARGSALAATPLKTYFDGQKVFATIGTTAISAGKLHYIVDYIPLTAGAHLELT